MSEVVSEIAIGLICMLAAFLVTYGTLKFASELNKERKNGKR